LRQRVIDGIHNGHFSSNIHTRQRNAKSRNSTPPKKPMKIFNFNA
jgi:hypothetical protein